MIKKYLFKQKYLILSLIASLITLILITTLYGDLAEPLLYPLLIITIIFTIYFIFDYKKFKEEQQLLNQLKNTILIENISTLKKETIIDNLYLEIIEILKRENTKILDDKKQTINNINDYYTRWVHQIKTPISALNFLVENEEFEQKQLVENEIFKIEQYVNMALTYLRLDSEYNDLLIEQVNVKEVINGVLRKYSTLFISKKIKLELDVNLNVISDKKWLEFILEQIISNAVKYSKKEGIIKIYNDKDSLYIEDNGIGIKEDNIPKLFEKGYTGFNGRNETKSSGLGLYLVKKSADKLGHNIKINSKLNEGTKVDIIFDKKVIL